MKIKNLLTLVMIALMISAFSQSTLELTFTAVDNAAYVELESIKVMNRTQWCDTVLFWPDTLLVLDYQLGLSEISSDFGSFQVFQNYPNPVKSQTTITIYVPERDEVDIIITDVMGRTVLKSESVLRKGYHSFLFAPGNGNLFFFTARWRKSSSSIKIHHAGSNVNQVGSLKYMGSELSSSQFKATEDIQGFSFSLGDELLYIGFSDTLQSGMLDTPETNETYSFQFATNIPCPGIPTIEHKGQVYNTIQIFSQCWLKENLNVGTMIQGSEEMTDNGIIEKYCYNNEPDSCNKYGALYQWDEMMQYTTQQGVQGICPPGWHLPTDEEWKVLEGAVDSQYGIGDFEWDFDLLRGFDSGTNLKTTSDWHNNGNGTDLFGFSGLPCGNRDNGVGNFYSIGDIVVWWTSTDFFSFNQSWYRALHFGNSGVSRPYHPNSYGFSVRCLRDY